MFVRGALIYGLHSGHNPFLSPNTEACGHIVKPAWSLWALSEADNYLTLRLSRVKVLMMYLSVAVLSVFDIRSCGGRDVYVGGLGRTDIN
jgi:hypothetical protein